MTGEVSVKIKISIWRDFIPLRTLILNRDEGQGHIVLSDDSDLQQEIYTWQTREDPFGGIPDDRDRQKLRELLIDRFAASKLPKNRRLKELDDFLAMSLSIISSGRAEWMVSQDAPFDDDITPYRINSLISFHNHIEWLQDVFADQPGVSMSVR